MKTVTKGAAVPLLVCFVLGLAGCGKEPSEKIHDHLEKSVQIEKDAVGEQEKIVELEKKEKTIYGELVAKDKDEAKKIEKLSEQANQNIRDRKDAIDREKKKMQESKEAFSEAKEQINRLDDKNVKAQAEKMSAAMMHRFDLYDDLNKTYKRSLNAEKKMYKLLADDHAAHKSVKAQIEKVNASYEKLIKENAAFNKQTEVYNELKKHFYEAAGLDIEYEE